MSATSFVNATQTLSFPLSRRDVAPHRGIFSALTLAAKNIENDLTFCLRQIKTAYVYDKEIKRYRLKADLHEHQLYVLKAVSLVLAETPFTYTPAP